MNVVNAAREIIERNGVLGDEDLAKARSNGLAELERRHGREGAAELLREGKLLFDLMAKRSDRLADLVDVTGVGSDPYFIETMVQTARALRRG